MARRAQPLRPPSAPKAERVAAFRLGLSAESRAAMFLIAKGYRILARRFKTPFGEIDIVARRRGALVFVEVKARGRADEAAEAVTGRGKQRRRRAVACPQPRRRATRDSLRRDPGDAGQTPTAHPQRVRYNALIAGLRVNQANALSRWTRNARRRSPWRRGKEAKDQSSVRSTRRNIRPTIRESTGRVLLEAF